MEIHVKNAVKEYFLNSQCVDSCYPFNMYFDGNECQACLDGCMGCSYADHSKCDSCDI